MRILSIETSCDETAVALLECTGDASGATFKVLGNALLSQIEIHKEYGGVFPALAKREHAKNLVPILEAALEEAELLREDVQEIPAARRDAIAKLLEREPGLEEQFFEFLGDCEPPPIDAIAVTAGPGLEPALWVGINFAKALALLWDKPLVAVNHMEGHIMTALARDGDSTLHIAAVQLPVLALLISGGHTELVFMKKWLSYELIGQTRDDAVGEAFDKVARLLGLPYPGGPEISKLAEAQRTKSALLLDSLGPGPQSSAGSAYFSLPRPMLNDSTCDFSFAGLKTAVLYLLKDRKELSEDEKQRLAVEFENAAAEVLWKKSARALEETGAKTLVLGGGVSANTHIRRVFTTEMARAYPDISLRIPEASLTTDNAIMIGLAGYFRALRHEFADSDTLKATGNLRLA